MKNLSIFYSKTKFIVEKKKKVHVIFKLGNKLVVRSQDSREIEVDKTKKKS